MNDPSPLEMHHEPSAFSKPRETQRRATRVREKRLGSVSCHQFLGDVICFDPRVRSSSMQLQQARKEITSTRGCILIVLVQRRKRHQALQLLAQRHHANFCPIQRRMTWESSPRKAGNERHCVVTRRTTSTRRSLGVLLRRSR